MSTAYFSPSYFAPSYFSNLSVAVIADTIDDPIPTPTPIPIPISTRSRDRDAYQAILDVVTATGAFDQILFGHAGPRTRAGADRYPVLMVTPKGWEETDDADPIAVVHRAKFSMTIVIRDEDPVKGFDELDRLSALVENVIDGSDLNGSTLAPLTKIRSARYIRATNPEQGIELDGEFTSLYQTSII